MKIELVDVCRPLEDTLKEIEELEKCGYLVVDQHGGGDIGSCLVYKKGETKEEEIICRQQHEKHMAFVNEYRIWSESLRKEGKYHL